MDLISKRAAEDLAHQVEQGKAIEREHQTKEWKDNFSRVREEVKASLRGRPDLAADKLLMDGELFGQKVQRPRLRTMDISPDAVGKLHHCDIVCAPRGVWRQFPNASVFVLSYQ